MILKTSQSNSANFVSLYTEKCHEHMVYVLQMLSFNIDNGRRDEPAFFKKGIAQYDLQK